MLIVSTAHYPRLVISHSNISGVIRLSVMLDHELRMMKSGADTDVLPASGLNYQSVNTRGALLLRNQFKQAETNLLHTFLAPVAGVR